MLYANSHCMHSPGRDGVHPCNDGHISESIRSIPGASRPEDEERLVHASSSSTFRSQATPQKPEWSTYICTVALALMCLDALAACSPEVRPTTDMGEAGPPKLRSAD